MKILFVNAYKDKGGAARATYRLFDALRRSDIDVEYVYSVDRNISLKYIIKLINVVRDRGMSWFLKRVFKYKKLEIFSKGILGDHSLFAIIQSSKCDLVHLHWPNATTLSIKQIASINKPVVWSLHDMWAFTGGCHYDNECGRYLMQCGACPVIGSNKEKDISASMLQLKKMSFSKKPDMTINGVSGWIAKCASESQIFKDKNVINLPNTIDTEFFKPNNKNETRQKLKLPVSRRIIIFGTMFVSTDQRKGLSHFFEIIKLLHAYRDQIHLVFFGMTYLSMNEIDGFTFDFFGNINSDELLLDIYNSADVCIFPSIQENLSNIIMESLSCGMPVVAFDIGGNGDMIDHQSNGYLAKPFDVSDMTNGIIEILFKRNDSEILSENARNKIVDNFSYKVVAEKYVKLYHSILQSKKTH